MNTSPILPNQTLTESKDMVLLAMTQTLIMTVVMIASLVVVPPVILLVVMLLIPLMAFLVSLVLPALLTVVDSDDDNPCLTKNDLCDIFLSITKPK
jgi:hypothetical protein